MEDLLFPHESLLNVDSRQKLTKSIGLTLWLTGLSGSGKTMLAVKLENLLVQSGIPAYVLDGDTLRSIFNKGLGFSRADRSENIRIAANMAGILAENGIVAIVSLVSPFNADRQMARNMHIKMGLDFTEVHVSTPLTVCEQRDPKGLYKRARAGEIPDFTGISSPYEEPVDPDKRYDLSNLDLLETALGDIHDHILKIRESK